MQPVQLTAIFLAQCGCDCEPPQHAAQCRSAFFLLICGHPLLIGHQRYFGINYQISLVRQMHDDIGPQQLVIFVPVTTLGFVLDAFAQARPFQHPLQDQLTPVALNFLVAFESTGQIGGFFGNLPVQLLQRFYFAAKRLAIPGFRGVDILNPFAKILQLVTEGVEQGVQLGSLAECSLFCSKISSQGSQIRFSASRFFSSNSSFSEALRRSFRGPAAHVTRPSTGPALLRAFQRMALTVIYQLHNQSVLPPAPIQSRQSVFGWRSAVASARCPAQLPRALSSSCGPQVFNFLFMQRLHLLAIPQQPSALSPRAADSTALS